MDTAMKTLEIKLDSEGIVEVLRARADSYRMLARLFLAPLSEEDIKQYRAVDFSTKIATLDADDPLFEGLNDMGRGLRRCHTGTRTQLSTDFTMCFDAVAQYKGEVASPYESVFLGEEHILYQGPRDAVRRIFIQEGVQVGGLDLPEDHLSFELDFLATISDRAADAFEQGMTDESIRLIKLSSTFLGEHVLSWIDSFSEIALKLLDTRFYRGVVKTTRAYTHSDADLLADLSDCLAVAA